MAKIIVTGGAGFIGSHIVDALVRRGHRVSVIDNLSTGKKENINPKAKFYKVDIRDKKIANIFKKEKPEAVFHYAAQIDARASACDPIFDAEINVLGSINILQNAADAGVKKIIFSSSGGSLSSEETILPTPEDKISLPVSPYGAAKFSTEMYLHYFWKTYGMKYVALRLANVYGPRQSPEGEAGVIAIFTDKMLCGKQPIIFGSGRQTRDYVYVGDVILANLLALKSNKVGSFNVGTSQETNVVQLFRTLKKLTGSGASEVHGAPNGQEKTTCRIAGEQMRSALDYSKIRRELGWKPSVSLDQGLEMTVEWFRVHGQ
ncbi:NAD-dependent epimerase/dehydratase family protein [Candidatus Falkowbacteria bacterium]|nr:NAD-dependent epimerase/dehydratase family protein [Candidatus Falkowbacteria bacterium]